MTTAKEKFFLEALIPTGQLLEIIVRLPALANATTLKNYSQACFDTLNLVAVAAATQAKPDLKRLAVLVDSLKQDAISVLKALPAKRSDYLVSALMGQKPTALTTAQLSELNGAFARTYHASGATLKAIHSLLKYSATQRGAWIASQLGDQAHPLFPGKRISKWRTFVRNLSWLQAARDADLVHVLALDDQLENNALGSHMGRQLAQKLWAECFGQDKAPEEVVQKLVNCIPAGVSVLSTEQGLLSVTAKFDPRSVLSVAQQKRLKDLPREAGEAVASLTGLRAYSALADLSTLSEEVAKAASWLKEQEASAKKAARKVTQVVKAAADAELLDRLSKQFSAAERKALAKLLAGAPAEYAEDAED